MKNGREGPGPGKPGISDPGFIPAFPKMPRKRTGKPGPGHDPVPISTQNRSLSHFIALLVAQFFLLKFSTKFFKI